MGSGFCMITNRTTGEAISDAAPFAYGSYQRNAQLTLTQPDESDKRQLWQINPLPTGGAYTIVNAATNLAWNNSGGSSNDGNPWISWDNDSNNPNKPNRHWRIIRDELKDNTGVREVYDSTLEYIITYSPSEGMIRFIGEEDMSGTYSIVGVNGSTVKSGQISESIDVIGLDGGVYVLVWEIEGRVYSRKFMKQ